MAEALELLTAATPPALVIEDLQWSNFSALDLISRLAQRRGRAASDGAFDLSARRGDRKQPSDGGDRTGTPGARALRGVGARMSDRGRGQPVCGRQIPSAVFPLPSFSTPPDRLSRSPLGGLTNRRLAGETHNTGPVIAVIDKGWKLGKSFQNLPEVLSIKSRSV